MKLALATLSALLGLAGGAAGAEMLATVDSAYLCPTHPFQVLSSSFKSAHDKNQKASNGTKTRNKVKVKKGKKGQPVIVAEQEWSYSDIDDNFQETNFMGKLWVVKSSPNKGLGLFARRKIPKGTRIIVEPPLFTVRPPKAAAGGGSFTLQKLFEDVETQFKRLSKAGKGAYLTCFENRAADDMETSREVLIFKNNAAPLPDGSFGIFPKIAKINHSCRPNSVSVYSDPHQVRIIVASRDLAKGEEITLTYVPLLQTTENRRDGLAKFGFLCQCPVCTAHDDGSDYGHGDARRVEMANLMASLEAQLVSQDKVRRNVLKRAERLVAMVEEGEGMTDYLAKAYHLAAFAALRKENPVKARHWAEKELEVHELADEDSQFSRAASQFLEALPASE